MSSLVPVCIHYLLHINKVYSEPTIDCPVSMQHLASALDTVYHRDPNSHTELSHDEKQHAVVTIVALMFMHKPY